MTQFCAGEGFDAIYQSIANGEGKPFSLAENLLRGYRMPAIGKSLVTCSDILAHYIGRGRVLILDNAHNLSGEATEWAMELAASSGFDLVFCGGLSLATVVNKTEQLRGRVLRPVVVSAISRADVAAFLSGGAFDMPQAVDALHAVARLRSGFHDVEKVLHLATLFAGRGAPDMSHLTAAIADLKLVPKGGK
jgi:hypothetical protein